MAVMTIRITIITPTIVIFVYTICTIMSTYMTTRLHFRTTTSEGYIIIKLSASITHISIIIQINRYIKKFNQNLFTPATRCQRDSECKHCYQHNNFLHNINLIIYIPYSLFGFSAYSISPLHKHIRTKKSVGHIVYSQLEVFGDTRQTE